MRAALALAFLAALPAAARPPSEARAVRAVVESSMECYAQGLHRLADHGRLDTDRATALFFGAQARGVELESAVTNFARDMKRLAVISGRREVQAGMDKHLTQILQNLRDTQSAASYLAVELALAGDDAQAREVTEKAARIQIAVIGALRVAALGMEPRRLAWAGREQLLGKFRQLQLLLDNA